MSRDTVDRFVRGTGSLTRCLAQNMARYTYDDDDDDDDDNIINNKTNDDDNNDSS